MHFKIKESAGKKQIESFAKLPPMFQRKQVYLRFIGGAFAYAIEHRYKKHQAAPDGSRARRFNNSGGLWSGLQSRIMGRRVVVDFARMTFPSAWALRAKKKFKDPADRKAWLKKQQKEGKTKKIRNTLKAKTVNASKALKGQEFLEPSRSEVNAILSWAETHVERNVFTIAASRYDKRPLPDRYNLILPQMPDPKTSKY